MAASAGLLGLLCCQLISMKLNIIPGSGQKCDVGKKYLTCSLCREKLPTGIRISGEVENRRNTKLIRNPQSRWHGFLNDGNNFIVKVHLIGDRSDRLCEIGRAWQTSEFIFESGDGNTERKLNSSDNLNEMFLVFF